MSAEDKTRRLKQAYHPAKRVRVTWTHAVVLDVPVGQTPQAVWEDVDLGILADQVKSGVLVAHDYAGYNDARFEDDETGETVEHEQPLEEQ